MGWKKDARKTIVFNISQQENDVLVRAEFNPAALNASDVRARIEQARANWNELISDLWYKLGDTQAPQQAIVNPPVNWELAQKTGTRMLYIGTVFTIVGIVGTFILIGTFDIILLGLMVVGILMMMNGGMKARSAKKGLARQRQVTS
jgi:hypothetical protein